MSKMVSKLAVTLAIATLVACASAEDFVPGRTHLVDSFKPAGAPENLFFRGNNPKVNDSFAYSELVATMKSVAAAANHTFPTTFKLVDVSLLVGLDPKESGDLKLEEDFFKANPTLGHLINWPLLTDLIGPCLVSESKRIKEATDGHWDLDDLPAKVPVLRSILHTPGADNIPTVLYVHCEAGVDRTGELCGSYVMEYQGQSFAEVLKFDDSVEPRPISFEAENGLEWYAAYVLGLAAPPLTTAALCCRYALSLQYNQSLTTPAY